MRLSVTYITLAMLLLLSGCMPDKQPDLRKWQITLDKDDKRPYGNYLAFQSLKYCFPGAEVQTLSPGFRFTNMDNKMKYNDDGHTLLILSGLDFYLSEPEWVALNRFLGNGNEVLIFCSSLDNKIERELKCEKKSGGEVGMGFFPQLTKMGNDTVSMASTPDKKYSYRGRSLRGYFLCKTDNSDTTANTTADSTYDNTTDADTVVSADHLDWPPADTLGYANGRPNFIRYSAGPGHITLHAAPLVLSNYFLLQPGNEQYLSGIWQTMPQNITRIYWSSYYKRSSNSSSSGILWQHPATKLALLLGIMVLLIYILFEGKRKQRIIPIIAPIKNDSVSFVETVGRLYYNKGNHANLADKMIQQFLEWVRMRHQLSTNLLNEPFILQLAIRSGQPEATVRELIDMIHEVRLRDAKIDDAYLYQLYNTIQHFYKNHRI
jgi:hypothetical protein